MSAVDGSRSLFEMWIYSQILF